MNQFKVQFFFFKFKILSIFNTHTRKDRRRFFKETYISVYSKGPNSWTDIDQSGPNEPKWTK